MEIRQFRVVLRAKHFERSCRFYGETLALARLATWEHDDARGALYEAGAGVIEVVGRAEGAQRGRDEAYEYTGPAHEMTLTLVVPSAQKAYETLHFRDPNVPGGLRSDPDGGLLFETHDPDGVKVLLREAGGAA